MLQMKQPRDMTSKSKPNPLTEGKIAQRTFFDNWLHWKTAYIYIKVFYQC